MRPLACVLSSSERWIHGVSLSAWRWQTEHHQHAEEIKEEGERGGSEGWGGEKTGEEEKQRGERDRRDKGLLPVKTEKTKEKTGSEKRKDSSERVNREEFSSSIIKTQKSSPLREKTLEQSGLWLREGSIHSSGKAEKSCAERLCVCVCVCVCVALHSLVRLRKWRMSSWPPASPHTTWQVTKPRGKLPNSQSLSCTSSWASPADGDSLCCVTSENRFTVFFKHKKQIFGAFSLLLGALFGEKQEGRSHRPSVTALQTCGHVWRLECGDFYCI